jgi:hypothetical protein
MKTITTSTKLRSVLKESGYRLPHGYELEKRTGVKRKKVVKAVKKTVSPKNRGSKTANQNAFKAMVKKAKEIQKHTPEISWNNAMKLAAKKK